MGRWLRAVTGVERQDEGVAAWLPHAVTRQLTTEVLDAMVVEYQRGAACGLLARRYGISETAVLDHLERSGVPRRHGKLSEADVVEMQRLRAAGWTFSRLAAKYGVTRTAVGSRLVSAGRLVPLRVEGLDTSDLPGLNDAQLERGSGGAGSGYTAKVNHSDDDYTK